MSALKNNYCFIVLPEDQDLRLDHFLTKNLPDQSRTALANMIKKGHVTVNTKTITKPGIILVAGQEVTLTIPQEKPYQLLTDQAEQLGITLLDQTDDFLIINKPAGLITHPSSPKKHEPSVSSWAVALFPDIAHVGNPERPGIVHRLDTQTSGLLIIARTPQAYDFFTQGFKERTLQKKYLGIVQGHPDRSGTITFAIKRHPTRRNTMIISNSASLTGHNPGRASTTHYTVQEYFTDTALVEFELITGRTHQIRVHAKAIHHPLVGDTVYGQPSKMILRQALHAHTLSFDFNGTKYGYKAPLPRDMQSLIAQLSKKKAS